MGLAAANVGRLDLLDGLDFVEKLGVEPGVPWVSTNLRRRDGTYPFPRFRILTWGSRKIAVLGLSPPDPTRDEALGIQVLDPVAAARESVAKLPAVDAVVCLSNLGLQEEQRLVAAAPGLTAVVGGGSGEMLPEPLTPGSTLILHAGDKGRYLGVLDLASDSLSAAGARRGTAVGTRAHRIIALDGSTGEDPEISKWVEAYRGIASAARPPTARGATAPVSSLQATREGPEAFQVGTSACRSCHLKAYESWLRTPHARSYAALSGKPTQAECLECHASLLSRREGALMEPDVACEACHGLGGKHRGGRGNITRRPEEDRCRRCHRGYHEKKKFDYRSAYQKVKCDKGETISD